VSHCCVEWRPEVGLEGALSLRFLQEPALKLSKGRLVSRPRNSRYIAGGQLAVFQGASEAPYLSHTGRASNAEKQPTGPGPEGCDENGPAAALLVGHVSRFRYAPSSRL